MSKRLWVQAEVSSGQRVCTSILGCLWDECLLISTKLDQLPRRVDPLGWVREPEIQAGVQGEQRGCSGSWGIHKCRHVCEPGECRVCACTSDLVSGSPQGGGDIASIAGAAEALLCQLPWLVTSRISVPCVCPSTSFKPRQRPWVPESVRLGSSGWSEGFSKRLLTHINLNKSGMSTNNKPESSPPLLRFKLKGHAIILMARRT